MHRVERAAFLHVIFVGIHPFVDGNGRIFRLLLSLELMKAGYSPVVIRNENSIRYYNALDKAHIKNEYKDSIELVIEELDKSLDLYLKLI